MIISQDVINMSELISFIEEEKKYAFDPNIDVENYATDVLKRFQKLYPFAILILGDIKIGSNEWKNSLNKDYVRCCIDGTWEFYSSKEPMRIKVQTNGLLDLNSGFAEQLFNYCND